MNSKMSNKAYHGCIVSLNLEMSNKGIDGWIVSANSKMSKKGAHGWILSANSKILNKGPGGWIVSADSKKIKMKMLTDYLAAFCFTLFFPVKYSNFGHEFKKSGDIFLKTKRGFWRERTN